MGDLALFMPEIPFSQANCTQFYAPDPAMDPEYGEVPTKKYDSSLSSFWTLLQAIRVVSV